MRMTPSPGIPTCKQMMMIRSSWLLLLFSFLFCACKDSAPSGVISENRMENLLYDYHLAQSMTEDMHDSANFYSHVYYYEVLRKHKVSESDFQKSLVWYNQHTDVLYNIYDRIGRRMDKEAQSLGVFTSQNNMYANLSAEGDTANIWNGRNAYLLSTVGMNNRLHFLVETDSTFLPKDRFQWHFTTKFIFPEGHREAIVGMYLVYDNDSVQQTFNTTSRDGEFSMEIYSGGRPIKSIGGFVYLNAAWGEKPSILSIKQPTLVRFHQVETRRENGQFDIQPTAGDTVPAVARPMDSLRADSVRIMDVRGGHVRSKPVPLRKKGLTPVIRN